MVGVQVAKQDGGDYTVSFANSSTLVQGNNTYQVSAVPSSSDLARMTLGYNHGQSVPAKYQKRKSAVASSTVC